jgi:hypothetical protein
MLVLSDAALAVVGKAFDRAWDSFLRTRGLTPKNFSESRNVLAARILRSAYYGEPDEWRLARDALSYLLQVTDFQRSLPNQRKTVKDADHRQYRRVLAKIAEPAVTNEPA